MKFSTALLTFLVFLLQSCATSPLGRSQLTLMPDSEMDEMGFQAFDKMKKEKPIEKSSVTNRYVHCVADAITHEVGGEWEVVVFKDDTPNAFALPSGKIGVHTGLLKVAKNQDQLAAMIGHEIAHVQAHHSNERVSQNMAVESGFSLIQAIAVPESVLGQTALGLLGLGAQYGIILPYSRTHEAEADQIGLDLMAKAGFDPKQSVNLWQNMNRASDGGQPTEFMSTHPSHDSRIKGLNDRMTIAVPLYQQAQASGKRPKCN